MVIGAVVGVAMALGHFPYLAGAARTLANTSLRLVVSGGARLVHAAARHGAPRRVALGATAVIAAAAPGITARLAVAAGRGLLRVRAVVALLLVAVGAASFAYHPNGIATGTVVLALALAGLLVAATGPLVAAPLGAVAGLIAGATVPALVLHARVSRQVVADLHLALFDRPGAPFALRVALVVVALLPFAFALRAVVRR